MKHDNAPSTEVELVALLHRIAKRDLEAFSILYRALERPLSAFIQLKLNDHSEVGDIVNETFLEVWRMAETFEGRSKVKTWVFAIAYRKVVDLIRRRIRVVVSDEVPEQVDLAPSPEATLAAVESGQHLRDCLARLNEDQRIAISLAFFDEMSYHDIAAVVGVPEGTVKSRVYHAKQALLHCLNGRLTPQDVTS